MPPPRVIVVVAALVLPLFFCARAAEAPSPVEAEARKLVRNFQFPQRFAEERVRVMQFFRERGAGEGVIKFIGERMISADFETPLASFVAKQFSQDHLHAINEYLSSGAGKREVTAMQQIYREIAESPADTFDVEARTKKFKSTLTAEDKKAIERFRQTEAGEQYGTKLPLVEKEFSAIFHRLMTETREQLESEAGAAAMKADARKLAR